MTQHQRHRIVFMGTPDFAVPSLRALHQSHDVVAVYSQPPRRSGRGMKTNPSPVHQCAAELGLQVRTPTVFAEDDIAELSQLQPDLLVVVAYGMILPQAVLDVPRLMPINGHASILPRWRGAAPIHRAIAAGDEKTGVTAMKMEIGLDTGPMLRMAETPIAKDDTTGSLHDRLAQMTASLLDQVAANLDDITPVPQNDADATWADKITPEEAEMNFNLDVKTIDQYIRAFSPFPGAWLALGIDGGKPMRLKVKAIGKVALSDSKKYPSGQFIGKGPEGGPMLAAADGAIELRTVQPQGKASMTGRDFLNGNKMPARIFPLADLLGA